MPQFFFFWRNLVELPLQNKSTDMTTKSTFRVLFLTQKGKPRPDGRVPVVARITINNEMAHFTTSVDVDPDHWLPKEGRTTGVTRDDKEANELLEDYRVVIRQKFNELMMNGEVVTAARVKMAVTSLDEKSYNLLEICQEFIDDYHKLVLTGSVTLCTYQRYVLTRERLKEFIKVKYRTSDLPISQINHSFIKGFRPAQPHAARGGQQRSGPAREALPHDVQPCP